MRSVPKRIFSILLSVCMLLVAVIPYAAFAEDIADYAQQTEDIAKTQLGSSGTYYSFDAATKTLTISGEGKTPDYSSSQTSSDAAAWATWRSNGSIEKVVVEEGVTALGAYLFYGFDASDFTLPQSLEAIGDSAFYLSGVKSLTLPNNLKKISKSAFYSSKLESIEFPASVENIGSEAFRGCLSLSKVTFADDNMTISIGSKAFVNCTALESVYLPFNATLGSYSFGYTEANDGYIYGVVLYVYPDSGVCKYFNNYPVACAWRTDMQIALDQSVERTYSDSNKSLPMTFVFVPDRDGVYEFSSAGEVAVYCSLYDENKYLLSTTENVEQNSSNFYLASELEAGKTYYYVVNSSSSTGTFSVKAARCDHDFETTVVDPTCTESGYTLHTCKDSGCGYSYKDNAVDALGHDYAKTVVAPTTASQGYTVYTCTRCGFTTTADYTDKLPTADNTAANTDNATITPTAEESKIAEQYGVDTQTAKQIVAVLDKYNVSDSTAALTEKAMTSTVPKNDGDYSGSSFGLLKAKATKLKKNSITVKWNKVKGADGYIIYGAKCGSKSKYKKIAAVSKGKTSYTQKKLKKGTYYKYNVVAYKNVNGVKVTIAASKKIHAITKGGKYGVAKSVKLNKSKVTLKKGKKFQIKASEVKQDKTIKKHRKLCYESSNTKIATVNSKGKITAKKKGKCTIYVYAQNGVYKTVTVTVK